MTNRVPKLAAAALLCFAQVALPRVALAQLAITNPLVITPTSPVVGQTATATFAVKNTSTGSVNIPYFLVGARTGSGASVDFPASQPVSLAPGQTFTYVGQRN